MDEAAELQTPLEDTEALRAQFTEEFAKYALETPDADVARLSLPEINEQVPPETATELQVLSVIQKIIQAAQLAVQLCCVPSLSTAHSPSGCGGWGCPELVPR